jgi:hypothetical protein
MDDALTELCRRDLLTAFHLSSRCTPLATLPARRFARMVRQFDQTVGKHGLIAGGQFILDRFTGQVTVTGAEGVPSSGPAIIASNHPGMTDAMAVWTAVARNDLLIIAAERDLLDHLPNMRQHLILIQSPGSSAYREALAHLKSGGAILTFPAGHIEPDAAVRPGAVESLATWSPSVVSLASRVDGCRLIPAFTTGVISDAATRAPFLRYLRDQKDRDWAAATLQILLAHYRRVHVSVKFGAPVGACMEKLHTEMRALMSTSISNPPRHLA